MSSGERPIGAAKGTQSDTKALCQHPPPPPAVYGRSHTSLGLCHKRWGGGGPGKPQPAHPHHNNSQDMKFIKGAGNLRPNLGTAPLFSGL